MFEALSAKPHIVRLPLHDVPKVQSLLEAVGLPTIGIKQHYESNLIARMKDRVVGMVGLEVYGDHGLIRSLAVEPEQQGSGLGRRLLLNIIRLAEQKGLADVFIVSTIGAPFFARHGFAQVEVEDVPEAIRGNADFQLLVSDKTVVLRRAI
ncbi:MAG: GNAT family N-acetyltransferase [Alphaproteobacteria bacterium CG_4_10_14_0_2_um_filter_63_37]|nr:MAG: hypothetical protein AUJ55_04115 [Proteobacteria bacterium CG1_02_64_396]PJA24130.1 MAG: GNAT family N-acetyltransferase [Alphaproteobacteria bacterium CG_4_10_14_0_2_um_filter_63_37]